MDFNTYQELAKATAVYPRKDGLTYTTLGLIGEAGEIANKVKKIIRDADGVITKERREDLVSELGDVLWYCAMLSEELGVLLSDVAELNIHKLAERKNRQTLQGDGDKR